MTGEQLISAIVDIKENQALWLVEEMLDRGEDPAHILHCCKMAMDTVGSRFEGGVYFLPELIMAGEILAQIAERVKPRLLGPSSIERLGRVVIGTVEGDIHDVGKNIVVFMLEASGFEVRDLGVDVLPAAFVEAVREFRPHVVGLSGFLTLAYNAMRRTVDALEEADLRREVKIMIGGGQMDERVRAYTGADAYGRDAIAAVALAKDWVRE